MTVLDLLFNHSPPEAVKAAQSALIVLAIFLSSQFAVPPQKSDFTRADASSLQKVLELLEVLSSSVSY